MEPPDAAELDDEAVAEGWLASLLTGRVGSSVVPVVEGPPLVIATEVLVATGSQSDDKGMVATARVIARLKTDRLSLLSQVQPPRP